MKFFLDSANLTEIESVLKRGLVRGVTTNPSILAKEPKGNFEVHVKKIIALLRKYGGDKHLSVEVFSRDPKEIVKQAKNFKKIFKYKHLSIKVQIGWNELEAISELSSSGISVNATACMSVHQALLASQAGARYVSLFWGRIGDGKSDEKFKKEREEALTSKLIDDTEFNSSEVVSTVRRLIVESKLESEIIVGSIRNALQVRDSLKAGAHIVTVPYKFFEPMAGHFKTTEVVEQFFKDFETWRV